MTQGSTQESTANDERAIRELVATWMTASQAGDIDTVLGLMTDDVVFMVPGHEPFGKDLHLIRSLVLLPEQIQPQPRLAMNIVLKQNLERALPRLVA